MPGFRRRCLIAVPMIAVALSSCDEHPTALPAPGGPPAPGQDFAATNAALFAAVRAVPDSFFRPDSGETNAVVAEGFLKADTRGDIHPHGEVRRRPIFNGKVLARLRLRSDYHGYRRDMWYRWIIADTSRAPADTVLVSVYVPEDTTVAILAGPITLKFHRPPAETTRRHLRGAWMRFSDGFAWTECTMWGCCCGSNKCDGRH